MRRRGVLASAACVALASLAPSSAFAQSHAMRIVVAYPPGGISDGVARLLALRLTEVLNRAVIVENQPGAGGSLALGALARVPADGRVVAFSAISPLALSPHFGTPAPNVVPITGIMHTPLLLVATPALAARTFSDMVRIGRSTVGGLRWATSGVATIGHLALEQVRRQMHLELLHVPYTGGGPQLQDALAGRFELLSTNLAPLQIDYVRTGKLHALAVGAPARAEQLPGVPTFIEVGCPGANLSSLFGLFAPPGTPAAVVDRLNAACAHVLKEPEFARMLAEGGNMPAMGKAADFAREIARQSEANAKLVAGMAKR